jgi:hypothetical protein
MENGAGHIRTDNVAREAFAGDRLDDTPRGAPGPDDERKAWTGCGSSLFGFAGSPPRIGVITATPVIERRSGPRYPVELEAEYRSLSAGSECQGSCTVLDMAGRGVLLLAAAQIFEPGAETHLTIAWPARRYGSLPLWLVVQGTVLRAAGLTAAISIERHRFRAGSEQ